MNSHRLQDEHTGVSCAIQQFKICFNKSIVLLQHHTFSVHSLCNLFNFFLACFSLERWLTLALQCGPLMKKNSKMEKALVDCYLLYGTSVSALSVNCFSHIENKSTCCKKANNLFPHSELSSFTS